MMNMNCIVTNQRNSDAVEAGTAYRNGYSKAKFWRGLNWLLAFALALGQVIVSLAVDTEIAKEYQWIIVFVLMVYVVVGAFARTKAKRWQSEASLIHSLHDYLVLGIGKRPCARDMPKSKLSILSKQWLKKKPNDKEIFEEWWSTALETVPFEAGKLIASLSTFDWETRLRSKYHTFVSYLFWGFVVALIILCIFLELKTSEALILTFAPFTPFLALLFDELQESNEAKSDAEMVRDGAYTLWQTYLEKRVSNCELEEKLEALFVSWQRFRAKAVPIFDTAYEFTRKKMEDGMVVDSQDLINRYCQVYVN